MSVANKILSGDQQYTEKKLRAPMTLDVDAP